jgi:hypothetical protein
MSHYRKEPVPRQTGGFYNWPESGDNKNLGKALKRQSFRLFSRIKTRFNKEIKTHVIFHHPS